MTEKFRSEQKAIWSILWPQRKMNCV